MASALPVVVSSVPFRRPRAADLKATMRTFSTTMSPVLEPGAPQLRMAVAAVSMWAACVSRKTWREPPRSRDAGLASTRSRPLPKARRQRTGRAVGLPVVLRSTPLAKNAQFPGATERLATVPKPPPPSTGTGPASSPAPISGVLAARVGAARMPIAVVASMAAPSMTGTMDRVIVRGRRRADITSTPIRSGAGARPAERPRRAASSSPSSTSRAQGGQPRSERRDGTCSADARGRQVRARDVAPARRPRSRSGAASRSHRRRPRTRASGPTSGPVPRPRPRGRALPGSRP